MFIWPTLPEVSGLAAGDGLDCGVGLFMGIVMSIFRSGDGEACVVGDGAPAGICIPGMFCMSIFCGDADGAGVGEAAGICMPDMFSIRVCPVAGEGVGGGDFAGMFMPFMFMPLMPCASCFFGVCRALCLRRTLDLCFDLVFRFALALAFGFDMFIPGMFCMSCPCCRAQATAPPVNRNIAAST